MSSSGPVSSLGEYVREFEGDWDDDVRMRVLFSGFKDNRAINAVSWDNKVAWWRRVLLASAGASGTLAVSSEELAGEFSRKGLVPMGLPTVLREMEKEGLIMSEAAFKAANGSLLSQMGSWTAWAVKGVMGGLSGALASTPLSSWIPGSAAGSGVGVSGVSHNGGSDGSRSSGPSTPVKPGGNGRGLASTAASPLRSLVSSPITGSNGTNIPPASPGWKADRDVIPGRYVLLPVIAERAEAMLSWAAGEYGVSGGPVVVPLSGFKGADVGPVIRANVDAGRPTLRPPPLSEEDALLCVQHLENAGRAVAFKTPSGVLAVKLAGTSPGDRVGAVDETDGARADLMTTSASLAERERKLAAEAAEARTAASKALKDTSRSESARKSRALMSLRKAKAAEAALGSVGASAENVAKVLEEIETALMNAHVASAMAAGGSTLKSLNEALPPDTAHQIMDDTAEALETAREITDALATPLHGTDVIDEDELEKELVGLIGGDTAAEKQEKEDNSLVSALAGLTVVSDPLVGNKEGVKAGEEVEESDDDEEEEFVNARNAESERVAVPG